jgi:hypothetical protein
MIKSVKDGSGGVTGIRGPCGEGLTSRRRRQESFPSRRNGAFFWERIGHIFECRDHALRMCLPYRIRCYSVAATHIRSIKDVLADSICTGCSLIIDSHPQILMIHERGRLSGWCAVDVRWNCPPSCLWCDVRSSSHNNCEMTFYLTF